MAATTENAEYIVPLLLPDPITESSAGHYDVFNPENIETPVWRGTAATTSHADLAISEASKALEIWSEKPGTERRDALLKAAQLLEENSETLARYMEIETGAPAPWTSGFNVPASIELCKEIAGRITTECSHAIWNASNRGIGSLVWKEPVGVVFALAPWNAPLLLGLRAVLFPLAAGCTVILKASERCPRTHYFMCELLQLVLPRGALSMVTAPVGDPLKITQHIIRHPLISKINFTGSTTVGRIIAKEAGAALKPLLLELGGKAAALVLEDADIEKAVDTTLLGAFLNAGQICMSTERVIVVRSVYDQFISTLKSSAARTISPGPLISTTASQNLIKLITTALDSGAKQLDLAFEAVPATHHQRVVLTDVTPNMEVFHKESFAPLLVITVVENEKEGIDLVNDCLYGLSASIFTKDLGRALKVAKKIQSGAVHINGNTVHDEATLPHGGVKESGYGRFGAGMGIQEFLVSKVVTFQ